jgi:uncharacterized membrane-anchored protein YitT (DUF2179 family)
MKALVTIVGVILIVVAAVYFLVPADTLPAFFPGHESGLARIRVKHCIAYWQLVYGAEVIIVTRDPRRR